MPRSVWWQRSAEEAAEGLRSELAALKSEAAREISRKVELSSAESDLEKARALSEVRQLEAGMVDMAG